MADSSLDLNINIGANTTELSSKLQLAENQLGQFQSALKKATSVGEINYLTKQIDLLQNSIKNTSEQMNKMGKPTGDATMALSNLSRVAQDAPYGFMGIANNLNPLLESFQRLSKETGSSTTALKSMASGLMGPAGIGLALGVVSSLFLAFGDDILNFINGVTDAEKAQQTFNKSLDDVSKQAAEQASSLNVLIGIAESANASDKQRATALDAVKDALSKVNQDYATNIKTTNDAKDAVNEYTKALIQQAVVQRFQDELANKAVDLAKTQLQIQQAQANLAKTKKDLPTTSGIGASMEITAIANEDKLGFAYKGVNDAVAKRNVLLKEQTDLEKLKSQAIDEAVKNPYFTGLYTKETPAPTPAPRPTTAKSATQPKEQVDTYLLETLKLKQRLYADDVYAYKEYADKITNEELRVALERARISKASATEIESIKEQSGIKLELNAIQLGKSLDRIFSAADKEWLRQQKENNKKAEDEEEKAAKIRLKQEADKQKQLEALQKQQEKFANFIASNLTGALTSMYDAMQKGESPLKALGDYFGKLVEQIAAAAIQAAIFQAILMAVGGGGGASFGEGFTGIFKGLLGMAEGGIVTRPTIAMVGEGGQSEAVMPLNKLGNMMNSTFAAGAMSGTGSGGNGQFVLRGQDLLLSINRSQKASNIKGQTISLA